MSTIESRCLDRFPEWLKSMSEDALAISAVVLDTSVPESTRQKLAGALNYLFRSLDLIPDGIEDLGFLDDAFVFRVAARLAAGEAGEVEIVQRLAADAALVSEFLGVDYPRLDRFVAGLAHGSARGRTVDAILTDDSVRAAFASDVKGWAGSFAVPSFARDPKSLVKLKSFLTTKLPA
jgi:uncharacterized membrane protein YkvA (DUF1232 family)